MNTKRHFTAEFKAKIVRQMLAEEQTINQLAAEHGIHPNQLYRWREIALAGLPSLFSGQAAQDQAARQAAHEQQVHDLYAQIDKLTTQLAWLEKKLAGELSRAARQALVDRTDPDVSLKDQAALLTLSRSSLYYRPVGPSAEEVALKHRIDEIDTASPFSGARRIAAQLAREGQAVDRKTVGRYMAEMGLTAIYPGPNLSKRAAQAGIYPYLLRHLPIV